MSFKVRKALASDAVEMAYTKMNAFKESYKEVFPSEYIEKSTYFEEMYYSYQKAIIKSKDMLFVVIYNNIMVGMFTVKECEDSDYKGIASELCDMYFLPAYWNKGYGKRTFRYVRKAVKSIKHEYTVVWVPKMNTRAKYFFEVCGFVADGKEREVKASDTFSYDEIRMVRKEELKNKTDKKNSVENSKSEN